MGCKQIGSSSLLGYSRLVVKTDEIQIVFKLEFLRIRTKLKPDSIKPIVIEARVACELEQNVQINVF